MRVVFLLFGFAFALVAGSALFLTYQPNDRPPLSSEIIITLILIVGVIALIAALGALAALLQQWKVLSKYEALALPAGSIRAVIALGLVLIFAMVSVYLVGRAADPWNYLYGLSGDQLQDIATERLLASYQVAEDRFDVVIQGARSEFQDDLSQHLMTLLGTLVTAVVAFYFGTAHPASSDGAASRAQPSPSGGPAAAPTAAAAAQEEAAEAQQVASLAQQEAAEAQAVAAAVAAQEEPAVAQEEAAAAQQGAAVAQEEAAGAQQEAAVAQDQAAAALGSDAEMPAAEPGAAGATGAVDRTDISAGTSGPPKRDRRARRHRRE